MHAMMKRTSASEAEMALADPARPLEADVVGESSCPNLRIKAAGGHRPNGGKT